MQTVTETWNGTNWTETGDLNTGRYLLAGSGTTTAGLAFGGNLDPGFSATTERFNGSAWTEINDLNTARNVLTGFGTDPATFAVGGGTPGNSALAEDWNGASWSEVADLNTARANLSSARSGTTTNGLVFAGNSGSVTGATEEWSGNSVLTKVLTD